MGGVVTLSMSRLLVEPVALLGLYKSHYYEISEIVPLLGFFAAPLTGWLADTKLGNYRVVKSAMTLIFLSTVSSCLCLLIALSTTDLTFVVMRSISLAGLVIGGSAYLTTSLQLGLDQMPDASASSITSFIACYVGSFAIGCFVSDAVYHIVAYCSDLLLNINCTRIWSFFLVFCMSIALFSDLFISSIWLIIEPKCPQSLKNVYQVLKFAAMHKAPLNRSAFTFWENNVPSRIDLGKSKYGGPFSTEEVEDVKTVLRLLLVGLPVWVIITSLFFTPKIPKIPTFPDDNISKPIADSCDFNLVYLFTCNEWWCIVVTTLMYELLVYPLARDKLPSILKKIGVASFILCIVTFLCLIFTAVEHYQGVSIAVEWIVTVTYWITFGFLAQVILTSLIEFVCAQSPYSVRELLVGYAIVSTIICACLGRGFSGILSLSLQHCVSS